MGRQIALLAEDAGFAVAAGVDAREGEADFPLYKSLALCPARADVLVDFSRAAHLPQVLEYALARAMPLVAGTTGLSEKHREALQSAARQIPVFYAENYSPGMHALLALSRKAACLLPGWDIEIIERHHRHKADAPGGTALRLYHAVAGENATMACGRCGAALAREKGEIGVHAVRGGTLAGTHEIGFYGAEETLYLTHAAQSAAVFARGALRAAAFLLARPPGLYGMDDLPGS